jgi:hypothetical protein
VVGATIATALGPGGAAVYIFRMPVLNVLIPIAIGATALVLVLGIRQLFIGGNPNRSNTLMRWRILLQFIAVMLIAAAALVMSLKGS